MITKVEKTVYVTEDGHEFDSEQEAKEHESFLERLSLVSRQLNPIPNSMDFINGDGFVQQTREQIDRFKSGLLSLAYSHLKDDRLAEFVESPDKAHPQGIVGRIIFDSDGDLAKLWGRLMNIDSRYREWGQPFYANNPSKAKSLTPWVA